MKIIRIDTNTINRAAKEAGMSAENFVSRIRSISLGRKVCAHFIEHRNGNSIFSCQ